MSKMMKGTVISTVAVFAVSVTVELVVNHMSYGKSSPYHLASLTSGVLVAFTFFFWRYIAERRKRRIETSCQTCKVVNHKVKQHLQIILYYADLHDSRRIKDEVHQIANLVDEPVQVLGGIAHVKDLVAEHNKKVLAAKAGA